MASNIFYMMISIGVYLIGVIIIGIWYAKSSSNVGDFYLGGRKLGPFVTAMSAEASDMSGWLLMGLPGVAYLTGVANAMWTAIGLAVGTYINWLLIAKRIRRYSVAADNAITVPDFFSKRYGDKKNILILISSVMIVIFFIPYTASGFTACGKLFHTLFGADYLTAMLVSAVVIVFYTCLGGFLATSVSDLMQSIVMSIALVIVLTFGVQCAGGMDAIIANSTALPGYLSAFETFDRATGTAQPYTFLTIISTLSWGLGYFGMPHILLRFMAIEDEKKLKLSRRIASVWVVISLAVAIFIGIVGMSASANGTLPVLNGIESETIIVQISEKLSHLGAFPAIIAGVIIAGILAATMSTADSQLLAASSSVSHNIIGEFFGIKLKDKTAMLAARLTVLGISVIAAVIAANPNSSVFNIVSFAWAGFGATFGPVVLAALFWRRSNLWGALSGMVVGGVTVFVWKYLVRPLGGIWDIYELLPAFILACAAIVIVSLMTKAPDKEITDVFDSVAAMKS